MLAERYLFFRKTVLRISQVEFSEKLGTKQGTIANWEKRGNEPSGRLLWAMIKHFALNPEWFFEGVGDPQLKIPSVIENTDFVIEEPSVSIDFGALKMPVSAIKDLQPEIARLSQEIAQLRQQANSASKPQP